MERVTIRNMDDLAKNSHHLPFAAITGIERRITDWLASGGNVDDVYIRWQYRYAENLINRIAKGGVDAGLKG